MAVATLAGLAASYVLIANVLLRTRLLRNTISGESVSFAVHGNSASLRLDYASAYSLVPGRVHLEGLTIRGRERDVEWFVSLDHTDVVLSLVDLLHRKLHATRLRSSGFTLRARLRLDPADAIPEVTAALPPIAGFADPPLRDGSPEPPPLSDADYKLWMVDLEDVDVEHVGELWIHTVRSEGDSRVRGRWVFRPQRWLEVGPATVDTNGVDVSYGSHPLATGLRGSTGVTVHPFDLRQSKGLEIFDHVSASGQLRGRANVAGALGLLVPRGDVRFTRWEGPLDARVVLDRGRFATGTHARIEAADGEIEAGGLAFEAPVRTELGIDGDLATLDVRVLGLHVSRLRVERGRIASIVATLTSHQLQLAQAFGDARFALDVRGAETNDVGEWRQYLPSRPTFVVRSGVVTADGHADGLLAERRGRARLRLYVRRLTVERGSERLTADVTGDAQLSEVSLSGAAGTATVDAEDVAVRLGPALVTGKLAAHVDLRRGTWEGRTFDLSGSRIVLRDVSVGSARGGTAILLVPSITVVAPRFALAPSGVGGRVSIDMPRADLAHLSRLEQLLPLPAGFGVEGGSGQARMHAEVDLGSGSTRGDGRLVTRGVRMRAGSTELFGDLDWTGRARRTNAGGSTDVSGSALAITRAGTGNGAPSEDAWWGNVTMREAMLGTSGGVRLDAKVHLSAKDATPATVLVSQNTGAPTWAANIFRMPVLDADAEVELGPSSIEVRSLAAHGGGTSIRAEYAKRAGRQDGAVLMDLGWIDLGYDLADGGTGLVLLGPRRWFAHKTEILRDAAAAARHEADAAEQLARYAAMTPELRKNEARALAYRCTLDVSSCDGASAQNLIEVAADAGERGALGGITYAPAVVRAAKGGVDGTTLDPVVTGSVAEALKIAGESALDNIPPVARSVAEGDSDAARGKVIAVTGRTSSTRREGLYAVGTLATDAGPVYFVTPFATPSVSETLARFRGVFVQRYAPAEPSHGEPSSLVLVGSFVP